MTSAVSVTGVGKSFDGVPVLRGVDLEIPQGEIFALLGANGAGKTTAISILTTLIPADAGVARVAGFDVAREGDQVRRRIALTGQFAAVDEMLTGAENLRMMGELSGLTRRDARRRATTLLDRFGLADAGARRAATYSGGMRRRLDLAVSFVVTPQVLFLDEPTTGLDTRSRRELWDAIRTLAGSGTTVFLTTQYLEEADALADRIAVLDRGVVVAIGTSTALKARVGTDTVELRDTDGSLLRSEHTDGTLVGVRRALDALALADHAPGARVDLRHPTLDDVFLAVTAGGADSSRTRIEESA